MKPLTMFPGVGIPGVGSGERRVGGCGIVFGGD